jgi:hypothetical protein
MQNPEISISIDPMDQWVYGISAIAKIINRKPGQAYYLAAKQFIDVERVGGRWRSTPRRLLAPSKPAGASAA